MLSSIDLYLGNFFFNSICHYFTISALKLVKQYKRLRTVSKAESEACESKKTPLQTGLGKDLWTAFTFSGISEQIYKLPECLVIWSEFIMGNNRNNTKANVIRTNTQRVWKLLRLLWRHRRYFRLSYNKMDSNLLT